MRRCIGFQALRIEDLRKTRSLIAASAGVDDPRKIYDLPGDWDNVINRTLEDKKELARKFGVSQWVS